MANVACSLRRGSPPNTNALGGHDKVTVLLANELQKIYNICSSQMKNDSSRLLLLFLLGREALVDEKKTKKAGLSAFLVFEVWGEAKLSCC